MSLADPQAAAAHARQFWNERYRSFSLSESGWMGAGEVYNQWLYECKRQAWQRALALTGTAHGAAVSVLDAGCGQGFFAGAWEREYPAAHYTGVDICEKVVEHLRGRFPRAEFFTGDLAEWRHPAGCTFDLVQSFEVLHLLLNEVAVARSVVNLAAQLKPGGHLLTTAVMPESAVEPNAYIRHPDRRFWQDTAAQAGLRHVGMVRMYYWLPDGGPRNRVASKLLRLPGPWLMFRLDRLALRLGLPQWFGSWDSRTNLHVFRREAK